MAIYHFSGTVISRSQGRSAVACAAYRSAEKLHDERYGKDHDYTGKEDVAYREILLPQNAPAWMAEREKLWNAVESHEIRKDAQLAREFNFALPRELTIEQNTLLAREFVAENFVKQGMVADLCIHNDKQANGECQPHVHVMLTMREVTPDGFGQKAREWNNKELLLMWRESWAETANHHLVLNGHDLSIDHRTLAEQKIDLQPQYKIGAAVARDRLVRMEDHQRIARENGEKILIEPAIALHAITRQQSTFTHQDLARFINRHTVDAEQFSAVYEKVKTCDEMVALGLDNKNRERFTTSEMLSLESKMMGQAIGLAKTDSHTVEKVFQAEALVEKNLSVEQKSAFDHLVGTGGLKCMVGYAGTGKSYLLDATRDAWEKQGLTVSGVTLAGIAAENLQGSSGIASRTFASRCHYWDKGEQKLSARDVLVVDEAGMLSSRQVGRLMDEASAGGAKVVLVGDPQQLQAIEAGAAFRAISERTQFVELTEIRRQYEGWQREATKELACGETAKAIDRYLERSHVHALDTATLAKAALVEHWNDARLTDASKTQIMLAYENKDVLELNQIARGLRQHQGELGEGVLFKTERGERTFAKGDRIYFLKNDKSLGVMNGTLGTVEAVKEGVLAIRPDSPALSSSVHALRPIEITMKRYDQIDYGYAATVHKAQGVTVDRSYVLASKYLDSHVSYVALSRHRESVDLFYGRDAFSSKHDLVKTLGRDRAKDVTLDYANGTGNSKEFAQWRGINNKEHDHQPVALDKNIVDENKFSAREREQLARQEKLRQFTETAKAERSLQGNEEKANVPLVKNPREDFSDFKRQFEEKYPERANTARLSVMPEHEKKNEKAMKFVHEYERLSNIVDKGGRSSSMAEEHLKTLSSKMARQKDVMQHVHEKHETIAKEIQQREKVLQREKSLDRGMEL